MPFHFHFPCHPNREHTEGRVTVPPGTARDFLLLACVHVCPSYETWLGFQFRLQHLLQESYMWLGVDRCFQTVHLRQIVKHRSTEHLPMQADRGSSRLSPFPPCSGLRLERWPIPLSNTELRGQFEQSRG